MDKKGFTLIEIIVVIALLGAIMLLVVPNITKNFKDSKKRLFYDNVISLYSSAGRSFLLSGSQTGKTFSNDGDALDAEVSADVTYKIIINSFGEITSIYVSNGTYTYSKSGSNITKKDIKLEDVIENTSSDNTPDIPSDDGTLLSRILIDNPTRLTRSDFSKAFTTTNTGTLYTSTESIAGATPKTVYYFAGNAKNNWVKIGTYYWRIIRTNHDGSIRLLFSGTSTDTTKGYLGKYGYNTSTNSPKYVGYMYGNTDSTLDEIRGNDARSNAYGLLSNWFVQTVNSKYSNYLSKDAVYCNDRELASGYSYSLNGNFYFKAYDRLEKSKNPTYDCTNNKDAFSLNNTETKFTLAVGLMTADEVIFAGGSVAEELSYPFTWYYNNATDGQSIIDADGFWTMTPSDYNTGAADMYYVNYSVLNGGLGADGVNLSNIAVRPVTSLKSCILWSKGDGSATSPYEIVENGGC
ncbi:MAG: type II secretion system GspH family protein [Tenericutes bacterium]|nr:type II secretion system GspH family protein [Mycoplasmatota bacterium]